MQIETGSVQRARICFGGMAATPRRAYHCEAALKDQPLDRQTLDRARDALERDFEPISDLRASSGYRQRIAGNLLEKAFLSMTGAQPAELYDGFLAPGHSHD
jgi:xanthine dehydrogenase iron-sulfur cluster and FAD-binding subunit A